MLYRAYLRAHDGYVPDETKTITHDPTVALLAFSDLVERTDLDGQNFAAVLTCQNKRVAFHRFDRAFDSPDYWRGRLHDIQWPADTPPPHRGGVREGAGRKPQTSDGGPLRRCTVTLDETTIARMTANGSGELSEGIRRAGHAMATIDIPQSPPSAVLGI